MSTSDILDNRISNTGSGIEQAEQKPVRLTVHGSEIKLCAALNGNGLALSIVAMTEGSLGGSVRVDSVLV